MKEQQERIERLAERWFSAQTTDAEERELREWLRQAEEIPASLREVQYLLGGLEALAEEQAPAEHKIPLRPNRHAIWGFMAAAAVFVGLFVGMELLRKPYCYIDGEAIYDRRIAMQATVYFEPLAALDESSRMVDELINNL